MGAHKETTPPHTTMQAFEIALHNAFEIYAELAQITKQEAIESYRKNNSTRDSVMLLMLAQADKSKLKALAAKL